RFVEQRSEASAKDSVDDAKSHAIGIVGGDADIADGEIGLRRVGFIDEQEALALGGRGGVEGGSGTLARRPCGEGSIELLLHFSRLKVAGDGQDRVAGSVVGFVKLGNLVAMNLGERDFVAVVRAAVAFCAEEIPVEIEAEDLAGIVLGAAHSVESLREELVGFGFGKRWMQKGVGEERKALRDVLGEAFGKNLA